MPIERTMAEYTAFIATKYPVVTITGPRQSGKTTLVKTVFAEKPYVNLERPDIRSFALEDPIGFLQQYPDGGVLDEIQRTPDLLSYIQTIVDETKRPGLFILTGSRQFELMNRISQSLAGRTSLLKLLPFSIEEMEGHFPTDDIDTLIYKGFYPRIHADDLPPTQALGDYYSTYVERDLRQLIQIKDLGLFDTFVRLCAGRVGQLLNLSSLANDAGVSHTTARDWINILEASFVIFRLPPYHTNTSKRLVKSPKFYFYDIGLAAYLCGIDDERQLRTYPLRGSFFENMVILEAMKYRLHRGKEAHFTFYRDSIGNEVDLLYPVGPDVLPIEIKSGQTISSDYFKGLRTFERFHGPSSTSAVVVYGGHEAQRRTNATITSIQSLYQVLDAL